MASVRKLRKCAEFVASLFRSRKSTKEISDKDDDEEFEFDTDPDAIKRGCRLIFPVFGREVSEFNWQEVTEEVIISDCCSRVPDLSESSDGDDHDQWSSSTDGSETSAAEAAEEFVHSLWKPNLRELSFAAPVEMSLFVSLGPC